MIWFLELAPYKESNKSLSDGHSEEEAILKHLYMKMTSSESLACDLAKAI